MLHHPKCFYEMEIVKIEIDNTCNKVYRYVGHQELKVVILTIKTRHFLFFRKIQKIKGFPLNTYFPNQEGKILYFYYVDKNGRQLGHEISKQINDFFLIEKYKNIKI